MPRVLTYFDNYDTCMSSCTHLKVLLGQKKKFTRCRPS
jgi:hypothetical protein